MGLILGTGVFVTSARADDQPAAMIAGEITRIERMLTRDASLSQDQRDKLARQLLDLPPAAVMPLAKSILTDPGVENQAARLSLARAISDSHDPSIDWIVPLFAVLTPDSSRDLIDAAATGLERYKSSPEVLRRLIGLTSVDQAEVIRLAAVRALGAFPEKAAAERLVALNADRSDAIVVVSDQSLIELSGLESVGPGGWGAWFKDRAVLSDQAFRDEISRGRLGRLEVDNREADAARQALQQLLRDRYNQSPVDARVSILREYLLSSVAATRLVGIQLIDTEAANVGSVAPELRGMLPDLLGDPSIDVRMRTARALQTLNDSTALDALMRRLALESSSDVRVILCDAIARIQDVRAAPVLVRLIDDPSPAVVTAAARALGELGPQLSSQAFLDQPGNRELVDQLTRRLRERFERDAAIPAASPRMVEQQQAMLDTLSKLRRPELMTFWTELLSSGSRPAAVPTPTGFRRAAIVAVGNLGDAKAVDLVANSLNDSSSEVRIEAAKNLALLSRDFSYGEALYVRTLANQESDPRVQTAAWDSLKSILLLAPRSTLSSWAERPDMLPDRKADVYRALVELAEKAGDRDDAATRRQQVGDVLFARDQFDLAVIEYQIAMGYLQALPNPAPRLPRLLKLTESTLQCLIRARRAEDAMRLAAELYTDAEYRVTIGAVFRQEAERLSQSSDRLEEAERFIDQVLKMNPPLQDQRQFLQRMLAEVQQRRQQRNDGYVDHLFPMPWDTMFACATWTTT